MTIAKRTPRNAERYDWTEIKILAMSEPGSWFVEEDPSRPKTTAHDIRRGSPKLFEPAGSFDALSRSDGLYLRYLGVPLYPWRPGEGDPRTFDELERTTDPDYVQPPFRLEIAERLVGRTLADVLAELRAKVDKKGAKKKHAS